ncbi:MAG: hypothetical protein HYU36_03250 [Planctomycetes bacterium]|nr:hypothetical protein [Planctomycetota bacterium]
MAAVFLIFLLLCGLPAEESKALLALAASSPGVSRNPVSGAITPGLAYAGQEWALLVTGCFFEKIFHNSIDLAYDALLRYGYDPNRVMIVSPIDPRSNEHLHQGLHFESRLGELQRALKCLSDRIGENDHLLIYVITHGGRKKGEYSVQVTETFHISAAAFSREVLRIPARRILAVINSCYSGGFGRVLWQTARKAGRDIVVATSTDGFAEVAGYQFGLHFWGALNDPECDLDEDGRVSFEEAFRAAVRPGPGWEACSNPGPFGYARAQYWDSTTSSLGVTSQ